MFISLFILKMFSAAFYSSYQFWFLLLMYLFCEQLEEINKNSDMFQCKDLVKLAKLSKDENKTLREELSLVTARELALKVVLTDQIMILELLCDAKILFLKTDLKNKKTFQEELETTRKSYDVQLQNLHEHIANLNIQLVEQSKTTSSFKDVMNGVTSTKQVCYET